MDFWTEDVAGVVEDIGEWFEEDFADWWTEDFVGAFEDIGEWFAGDFVDWLEKFAAVFTHHIPWAFNNLDKLVSTTVSGLTPEQEAKQREIN